MLVTVIGIIVAAVVGIMVVTVVGTVLVVEIVVVTVFAGKRSEKNWLTNGIDKMPTMSMRSGRTTSGFLCQGRLAAMSLKISAPRTLTLSQS
jgi:hypothetical protein